VIPVSDQIPALLASLRSPRSRCSCSRPARSSPGRLVFCRLLPGVLGVVLTAAAARRRLSPARRALSAAVLASFGMPALWNRSLATGKSSSKAEQSPRLAGATPA
jgi:hypothetical protein